MSTTSSKVSKRSKLKINSSSEAEMRPSKSGQDEMPVNESDIKMGTISYLEQSIQRELDSLKRDDKSAIKRSNNSSAMDKSKYNQSIHKMIEIN